MHCGLGENGECSYIIIFVIICPHASFQGKRSFEFYRRNQGTKDVFARNQMKYAKQHCHYFGMRC